MNTVHKNLPAELLASLQGVKGFDEKEFIAIHASEKQVTSVRYNPQKINEDITFLSEAVVPWCPHGRYLKERPSFTLDPLFHAGVYYVQEASSMFLWQVLAQTCKDVESMRVLDLCAAPGGKSTLLASYFTKGLIVANEVIKSRASVLVENLTKWGSANVVVTNNDPRDFQRLEGYFDVMVIDAPCSGSGLFRKDNEAINEWSEDSVALCSMRQQRILADAYGALKQDGVLIYSTCSYSREEDEDILDWLADNFEVENVRIETEPGWNIVETVSEKNACYGYRFYPDKLEGEGFFIAAFKKKDAIYFSQSHQSIATASKNEIAVAKQWLKDDASLYFIKQKEALMVIPASFVNDVALLQTHLYLRKAGVELGTIKGKDFVPAHALALSLIGSNSIPKVALNKDEALQFLRKKDVTINTAIKGWALVAFNGVNLGWMKVLHNRVNNYYPTEWRILKD